MEKEILLIDQTIQKIEFIFRYGGYNIMSTEATAKDYIKSMTIYIINWFWLNMDLAGGIYWFIEGVQTGQDFLGLTYIAPCISLSTLADIKGLGLVANGKHVLKLIENLRDFEKKEKERLHSMEKDEIIRKERVFLHNVINVNNWMYIAVIITFALSPIAITTVKYYKTGQVDLILPFLVIYPFDPFKLKNWPFVYFHQIWSESIVALNILAADYLFFTCCIYLRIQFKLLQYNIETSIPIQNDLSRKFLDDDTFKAKLRDFIRWHQNLIETTTILEAIYSKSMLLNFVSSSMIICLTGFNVTMIKDVAFVVTFLSFLFMSLFQIFFLCFFADLLMTSSMEVSDAVYKSQWYMADVSVGKKLLLMQIRSQEPVKLTAYGYANVNLNSFMRVLSTAWSYFALLQTIYGA